MYSLLQGAISGLHVLVALAGVAVSVVYLKRSRWAALLAAAFTAQAFVAVAYRVLLFLATQQTLSFETVQPAYLVLGFIEMLAIAAVVAGLALVLSALPAPVPRPIVPPES